MNQRQRQRFLDGRQARLNAELALEQHGTPVPAIPLYSHDATLQSFFNRGWNSVTATDVRMTLSGQQSPCSSHPSPGTAARAEIGRMLGRQPKGVLHGPIS